MLFNSIHNKKEAYNLFSTMTKQMIQDVGNVELVELFETDPKTQCTECLSYWSEGIVYCTCGHLLKETVANRTFIEFSLDLLSIPEYVIKKGRPHGHRYGKLPENKSDFNQALSTLNRLQRESGGQQLGSMPYWKYQQRQPSSSSSSNWWQWSGSWWSS